MRACIGGGAGILGASVWPAGGCICVHGQCLNFVFYFQAIYKYIVQGCRSIFLDHVDSSLY